MAQQPRRITHAPPQWSADGRWWWDGQRWIPRPQTLRSEDGLWWWNGERWLPVRWPRAQLRPRDALRWFLILITAFGAVGTAVDVWAVILMIYNLPGPSFGIPPQDADILIPGFVPLETLGPPAFLVAIGWWIMLLIQKLRSQRAPAD